MTNLNDRIVFTFTGQGVTSLAAGMHTYKLWRTYPNELVFAGNLYYNGTDTSISLDVSDIIASDGSVVKEDDFNTSNIAKNKIVDAYFIEIINEEDLEHPLTSPVQWVAKVYDYENKQLNSYLVFFNPDSSPYTNSLSVLLQGFSHSNQDSKLIPHYPMQSDEQLQDENACPFGLSLLVGSNVHDFNLVFVIGDDEYNGYETITPFVNSFSYLGKVGDVCKYTTGEIVTRDGTLSITDGQFIIQIYDAESPSYGTWLYRRYPDSDKSSGNNRFAYVLINNSHNKDIDDTTIDIDSIDTSSVVYSSSDTPILHESVYDEVDDTEYLVDDIDVRGNYVYKVAVLDVCPKKYYLFWQDRYGSFQCQAFNEYANYSETFDRTEIQDYQNRRRLANIQVQGKWKLNSGWIPEELYPYYESIYTSPILILYDSVQNKRFTVLVSGNYDEKTYRNQKKMVNMNLELTLNKKQNIIY